MSQAFNAYDRQLTEDEISRGLHRNFVGGMRLDLLRNEGVLALNKPSTPLFEKTVVVLGVARGGTTMVASVLQALGVFMGDKLGPVLEDVTLSQAVESHDIQQLKELVASRNAAHSLWGWKRPAAPGFKQTVAAL